MLKKKKGIKDRIIKDRIIRDIRVLSEKEDDHYKPKRVSNIWNNNYIEYESNDDGNKNFLGEYLDKFRLSLRDMI